MIARIMRITNTAATTTTAAATRPYMSPGDVSGPTVIL